MLPAVAVAVLALAASASAGAGVEHSLELLEPTQMRLGASMDDASITLSATTVKNNDFVDITVKSNIAPTELQLLAAYSPADADITESVPVKYAYLKQDPDYMVTGEATLRFKIIDMRSDYVFYFYNCSIHYHGYHPYYPLLCEATGKSKTLTVQHAGRPLKPRVVPDGADPTSFSVVWSSAHADKSPTLRWGFGSGKLDHSLAADRTWTYTRDDMCAAPATGHGYRDIGFLHRVSLGSLPPSSRVYYRLSDSVTGDSSEEYSFKTPPAVGPDERITLFAYADMGRSTGDDSYTWGSYGRPAINTTRLIAQDIANGVGDAVFHFGDISYAVGFAAVWDEFLNMLTPVSSALPYTINPGNHEADAHTDTFPAGRRPSYYDVSDSGGECNVPVTNLFPMPRPNNDNNDPWWSWDIGPVHITSMSTEHNFTRGSDQWRWLKQDLEGVDRSKTPWIIFGGHRPMYISSTFDDPKPSSDQSAAALLREHVEPLLAENDVQLAVWGHNHAYQRFCAAWANECATRSKPDAEGVATYADPEGPVQLVVGTAGASLSYNAEDPPPSTLEVPVLYVFGYTRVHVHGSSKMEVEFVDNTNGEIRDRFRITVSGSNGHPSHHGIPRGAMIVAAAVAGAVLLVAAAVFVHKRLSSGAHVESEPPAPRTPSAYQTL